MPRSAEADADTPGRRPAADIQPPTRAVRAKGPPPASDGATTAHRAAEGGGAATGPWPPKPPGHSTRDGPRRRRGQGPPVVAVVVAEPRPHLSHQGHNAPGQATAAAEHLHTSPAADPASRGLDPARRRPDPDPVAGGGEGATRFVAGRRWKAGEERGRRAREGRAEPSRPLPLPGPSPAAAAGGRASGVRPQAVRARRL